MGLEQSPEVSVFWRADIRREAELQVQIDRGNSRQLRSEITTAMTEFFDPVHSLRQQRLRKSSSVILRQYKYPVNLPDGFAVVIFIFPSR